MFNLMQEIMPTFISLLRKLLHHLLCESQLAIQVLLILELLSHIDVQLFSRKLERFHKLRLLLLLQGSAPQQPKHFLQQLQC